MKKIISGILAAALAMALLAGCGGKPASSSSRPASSSAPKPGSSISSDISDSMGSGMTDESGTLGDSGMSGSGTTGSSGVMGESGMTGSDSILSSSSVAAMAAAEDFWYLRVVNKQSPLPDDFTVGTRNIKGYDSRLFDARAADALEAMLEAAEQDGAPLYLVSAYRSIARQKNLFARKVNYYKQQGQTQQQAEESAAQWVARPGTSEHNLGLAADIVSKGWYTQHEDLTQDFDQTPEFAWLQQNAAQYGFILRYPKGKEAVTGVVYEPWHYRFVGNEAADALRANGLALEEYVAALRP